jgi:hypothetical protein
MVNQGSPRRTISTELGIGFAEQAGDGPREDGGQDREEGAHGGGGQQHAHQDGAHAFHLARALVESDQRLHGLHHAERRVDEKHGHGVEHAQAATPRVPAWPPAP